MATYGKLYYLCIVSVVLVLLLFLSSENTASQEILAESSEVDVKREESAEINDLDEGVLVNDNISSPVCFPNFHNENGDTRFIRRIFVRHMRKAYVHTYAHLKFV